MSSFTSSEQARAAAAARWRKFYGPRLIPMIRSVVDKAAPLDDETYRQLAGILAGARAVPEPAPEPEWCGTCRYLVTRCVCPGGAR